MNDMLYSRKYKCLDEMELFVGDIIAEINESYDLFEKLVAF